MITRVENIEWNQGQNFHQWLRLPFYNIMVLWEVVPLQAPYKPDSKALKHTMQKNKNDGSLALRLSEVSWAVCWFFD